MRRTINGSFSVSQDQADSSCVTGSKRLVFQVILMPWVGVHQGIWNGRFLSCAELLVWASQGTCVLMGSFLSLTIVQAHRSNYSLDNERRCCPDVFSLHRYLPSHLLFTASFRHSWCFLFVPYSHSHSGDRGPFPIFLGEILAEYASPLCFSTVSREVCAASMHHPHILSQLLDSAELEPGLSLTISSTGCSINKGMRSGAVVCDTV